MMLKMVNVFLWQSKTWGHVRCSPRHCPTIQMEGTIFNLSNSKAKVISVTCLQCNLYSLFIDLFSFADLLLFVVMESTLFTQQWH